MKKRNKKNPKIVEATTLGGGCFWCTEAVFSELKGVLNVEPGYSGGWIENPTYEQVCGGTTGHAEVVQITFDPKTISFREILKVFFSSHNPITINRQGSDIGTQYRSVIFYHTNTQKSVSEELIKELNFSKKWQKPIITEVASFETFYQAENYHRNYFQRNPYQTYCQLVIKPKISKLRQHSLDKLKKK